MLMSGLHILLKLSTRSSQSVLQTGDCDYLRPPEMVAEFFLGGGGLVYSSVIHCCVFFRHLRLLHALIINTPPVSSLIQFCWLWTMIALRFLLIEIFYRLQNCLILAQTIW